MKGIFVRLFTLSLFLTVYFVMLLTFLVAWMSQEKVVVVAINNYGEAAIELALLLISFVPTLIGTGYFVSDTVKELEKGRK